VKVVLYEKQLSYGVCKVRQIYYVAP
jgi:hypothetical protein